MVPVTELLALPAGTVPEGSALSKGPLSGTGVIAAARAAGIDTSAAEEQRSNGGMF